MTVPREELLAYVSSLAAREVKDFDDLSPMEVEALLRVLYEPKKKQAPNGWVINYSMVEVHPAKRQIWET